MLSITRARRRILVDFGQDWIGELDRLMPQAIVLTHAHGDHAGGLRRGARCPVYATEETWTGIDHYPIERRERVTPRAPFELAGIVFEAFQVEHSLRAPAVGYRIRRGGTVVFYTPDLVAILEQEEALRGIRIYIGDGASFTRSIVRRRNGVRIGHASIREQLDWCVTEGVSRAVFTHCGSQIVRAEQVARSRVVALGHERGVRATIAHDDLRIALR